MRLRTGRQDMVAGKSSGANVWNPMTEDLDFASFKDVDFRVWVSAATNVTLSPGYQLSKDGVDWDTAVATETLAAPTNDTWNFSYSSVDLTTAIADTNKRLFIRFGLMAEASDDYVRPFQAELEVGSDPVNGNVVVTPWALVYADSSSSTRTFDLTAPLPLTERISEVRAALELESKSAASGELEVAVVVLQANKPMDPTDWSVVTTLDWVTATDFGGDDKYGQEFTACAPTKRYIKFGVKTQNTTANSLAVGRVRLRVEYRD